ncbi:DNA-binding response regulator [Vibrio nigripulchritudo]|uniref:Response regulator containing a CheY-like receiver domain and an HTH DNA-binding domain n=1 Tax=Vibrio nigripulchritudo SOn1 TaxID=1238450 RepID=A0AAV2VT29_9VIBR|nr:response regulator transcription factor [Vibrio nigripulchritudo]BCL71969.1 DNA-binding response regulator [Vibrio nigripulchritudo]BDU33327.1 DNA-binding response regulator [Vibrio nigripulchritudo]CCO47740.1 putative Response regulator containing a CheY-like receiver domain and an HTH DNA-binding domain [Vibrio nigripulchritudo SOn1]
MTRLLIVEDIPAYRQFLSQLSDSDQISHCDSASCLAEAFELVKQHQYDLALVDLGLPDGNGRELIAHLRTQSSKTEIMVLTIFGDEDNVLKAIEAGARGYLLKDTPFEQIEQAIANQLAGGAPMSAAVAAHVLNQIQGGQKEPLPNPLTGRENEVLTLLAKGLKSSEISNMMGISHYTVNDHIKAIYRKLEVNSRCEAVYEANQQGLIK